MAALSDFAAYCVELLSVLGPVRPRRMFGGYGFYVDDVFVAIIIGERLYLKTDEPTRAKFEAAGSEAFVYQAKGRDAVSMSYWSAPDEAMESPDALRPWGRLAMESALRVRNATPAPRKKAAAPDKTPVKRAPARATPKRAAASKAPAKKR